MAKPIKIWTGTEWVEVAVSIPNLDSYATSSSVTSAISDHESDTTNVHGIADTSVLATESYADSAAAAAAASLVNSAPSTLDTLNELAAALGDDPNFATTVTNSIASKAPLNSPTFTGTVTVPNTLNPTDAASKNYVDLSSSGAYKVVTVSGDTYSTDPADAGHIVMLLSNTSTAVTYNQGDLYVGQRIDFFQFGTGTVTFFGNGVSILSKDGKTSLSGQYSAATLIGTGVSTVALIGDLA